MTSNRPFPSLVETLYLTVPALGIVIVCFLERYLLSEPVNVLDVELGGVVLVDGLVVAETVDDGPLTFPTASLALI